MEPTDSLTKRGCLETAESLFFRDEITLDEMSSPEFVQSLKSLYDSLQTVLSDEGESQHVTFHGHRQRWYLIKPPKPQRYSERIKDLSVLRYIVMQDAGEVFDREIDLYRAMWFTSLVLLTVLRKQSGRSTKKRKLGEANYGATNHGDTSAEKSLETTIQRCRLLVRVLEKIRVEKQREWTTNGTWEERIREWTEANNTIINSPQEEDGDFNLLSLTREQLEEEEHELLMMASTPIPVANNVRRPPQTVSSTVKESKSITMADEKTPHRSLRGKVLEARELETVSRSITLSLPYDVALEEHSGIFRPVDTSDHGDVCYKSHTNWAFALTSRAELTVNESTLHIKNVISDRSQLMSITLDVGNEGVLWRDRIRSLLEDFSKDGIGCKLANSVKFQEEIALLWPTEEVNTARDEVRSIWRWTCH